MSLPEGLGIEGYAFKDVAEHFAHRVGDTGWNNILQEFRKTALILETAVRRRGVGNGAAILFSALDNSRAKDILEVIELGELGANYYSHFDDAQVDASKAISAGVVLRALQILTMDGKELAGTNIEKALDGHTLGRSTWPTLSSVEAKELVSRARSPLSLSPNKASEFLSHMFGPLSPQAIKTIYSAFGEKPPRPIRAGRHVHGA